MVRFIRSGVVDANMSDGSNHIVVNSRLKARIATVRFTLAGLLCTVTFVGLACALGRQFGAHGLIASLDVILAMIAIASVFKINQVCGVQIRRLTFAEFVVLLAICFVLHGLAMPAVQSGGHRRRIAAPVNPTLANAEEIDEDDTVDVLPPWERWEIRFSTASDDDYAKQLDHFEIELGALHRTSPDIEYARNLAKDKPPSRKGTRSTEPRLYLIHQKAAPSVTLTKSLLKKAGIPTDRCYLAQFYPEAAYRRLLKVEKASLGMRNLESVRKTVFAVRPRGDGFEFFVVRHRFVIIRTWTDRTGRQVEAELIAIQDGNVRIKRKSDGETFDLPLEKLSDVDQDFVKSQVKETAKQETATPETKTKSLEKQGR